MRIGLSGFLVGVAMAGVAGTPVTGRFVRVAIPKEQATLSLAEVQIFSGGQNVALKGIANQSETAHGGEARRAIDGNATPTWGAGSMTHTPENHPDPWWEVDLRKDYPIERIVLWNRVEIPDRLNDCSVMVIDKDRKVQWEKTLPKPNPKDTVLTVDAADHSGKVGQIVKGYVPPASDQEIVAAYEKKGNWIESVLAVQDKLESFRSLKALAPLLLRDFPAASEEIREEFIGKPFYHTKDVNQRLRALAVRYVAALPEEERAAFRAQADAARQVADLDPIRAAFRRHCRAMRLRTALATFNPEAMERAITAYSAKYPAVYDKAALLGQLAAAKAAVERAAADNKTENRIAAARAVDALNDAVYLKHPAIDFREILFIRRSTAANRGLPQNWQGNSSTPLHGYINDVVRAPLKQGDQPPVSIYASSSFVGDVDLDFDAEKIMFSTGKNGEQGWRVFESGVNGKGVREVTPGDQTDIDFYDPCYLPDGRILFCATSGFHGVPCVTGSDYVGNLHLMEKDGSIRRLVFDQDNSWCPTVMPNGRILFLRWEYTDSAHYFSRVLMTMNPDGTDQQEFFGSGSYWPNSCFFARPIPGSTTKFVGIVTGHHGVARMGMLTLFDVSSGRLETTGAVQTIPGYGKPVENKTRDQLAAGLKYYFLHPYPLDEDLFLVSMSVGQNGPFYVALADRYDNLVPLWQSASDHLFEPIPLKKQPKPLMPVDRVVKGDPECTMYMVSAENGPGLAGLPKGKVKALRVFNYEYSPRNTGGHYHIGFEGPWDPRVMLGTVKVEEDGSCMFKAPANTPITVQPLDADGKALQLMRSWLVGMPGEVIACMGCHEKQNAAAPTRLSIAAKKPPQKIQPWFGPRRSYAFEREVQNVLDRACVGCHNGKATAKNALGQPIPNFENTPGLGGFSTAYVNLHPYVRRNGPEGDYHILTPMEFYADTSELVQLLSKGHHGVALRDDEWDRLITWIDLNVPYWGTWTERERGGKAACLARRKEMAKKYANIDFDPEVIVNPYKPVAFTPPAKPNPPPPAPDVAGWPIDDPKGKQGNEPPVTVDLGGGERLTFVRIPAGTFVMGSNRETPAERPMAAVKIGKPFLMATTEISAAQFRRFDPSFDNGVYDKHYKDQVNRGYDMGNQTEFAQPGNAQFPAIRVSWVQANAFCEWLGKKIGKRVMLPTEAQWEWACRAGTDTPMNYGGFDTDFGKRENLADYTLIQMAVSGVDPQPIKNPPPLWDYELRDRRFNDGVLHLAKVGSYAPNAWGLHDMHGNVAEWTRSAYRPYPYVEGDGRNNGNADERKTVRGGSWYRRSIRATSSWRWGYPAWMRPFDVGFRVVIED